MSVVGISPGSGVPARAVQPVAVYDPTTGLPGAIGLLGGNGTSAATQINPISVTEAQGVIASGPITLVAATAQTIIGAFADRRGFYVLNYTASPVYLSLGTTGTPASGGGSLYVPAAAAGVPGAFLFPFAPVTGVRAVGAAAGDLTIVAW